MAVKWIHQIRHVAHTSLSQGSCIGYPSTSRQIGHINSSIADSICAVPNGGWFGFCMIFGGAIALTCCTILAGLLVLQVSTTEPCKMAHSCYNPLVREEGIVNEFFVLHTTLQVLMVWLHQLYGSSRHL